MQKISIAIHGGAGTILKEDMTAELEEAYKAGLQQALDAGFAVLELGGTSVTAVKAAVIHLFLLYFFLAYHVAASGNNYELSYTTSF